MGAGGDPEGEDQDHGESGCDYHNVETADAVAEPAGYDAAEDTVGKGLDTKNAYFSGHQAQENLDTVFFSPSVVTHLVPLRIAIRYVARLSEKPKCCASRMRKLKGKKTPQKKKKPPKALKRKAGSCKGLTSSLNWTRLGVGAILDSRVNMAMIKRPRNMKPITLITQAKPI